MCVRIGQQCHVITTDSNRLPIWHNDAHLYAQMGAKNWNIFPVDLLEEEHLFISPVRAEQSTS